MTQGTLFRYSLSISCCTSSLKQISSISGVFSHNARSFFDTLFVCYKSTEKNIRITWHGHTKKSSPKYWIITTYCNHHHHNHCCFWKLFSKMILPCISYVKSQDQLGLMQMILQRRSVLKGLNIYCQTQTLYCCG